MKKFAFPTFRDVYNFAPKYKLQHLKFTLRCLFSRNNIKAFETFVNTCESYLNFFRNRSQDAYPLIHAYMDKRFNGKQRLSVMTNDLKAARSLFGQRAFAQIAHADSSTNSIVLSQLTDELSLCLHRNDNCVDEGWWAVSLRDTANQRLYAATFAFINHRLVVGSVQGPAGEHAKDLVKKLTKQLHGLRPQNLVVTALQYLAACLSLENIAGISQADQVKLRWRLKKRVQMDYDVFWQNVDAKLHDDGYWHLPAIPTRKELTEIESKKRSMYRKRYEILDKLFADTATCLQTN
ncbi:DUF535 domain-containing protein [Neisseria brasiliensis]|uniref:VirK/YbjX family protein n=1 Tax=Neisseria TaxID=482 RepID=UPI000C2732A9|nr:MULTISPECIES: DUF535 family protein [Neisseria]PJO78605.1 DUF535 domain-containing protein [Neisseria sp. N177_16]QGL25918.1 DUF535 domain-containing protein [Neisseria brasiliensis]